jgi:hypothetical protein
MGTVIVTESDVTDVSPGLENVHVVAPSRQRFRSAR